MPRIRLPAGMPSCHAGTAVIEYDQPTYSSNKSHSRPLQRWCMPEHRAPLHGHRMKEGVSSINQSMPPRSTATEQCKKSTIEHLTQEQSVELLHSRVVSVGCWEFLPVTPMALRSTTGQPAWLSAQCTKHGKDSGSAANTTAWQCQVVNHVATME